MQRDLSIFLNLCLLPEKNHTFKPQFMLFSLQKQFPSSKKKCHQSTSQFYITTHDIFNSLQCLQNNDYKTLLALYTFIMKTAA